MERVLKRKAKKQYERRKNKIIWRHHTFFMNFHSDWESPLTGIDRSSCCHTVSTWGCWEALMKAGDWIRGREQPPPL